MIFKYDLIGWVVEYREEISMVLWAILFFVAVWFIEAVKKDAIK